MVDPLGLAYFAPGENRPNYGIPNAGVHQFSDGTTAVLGGFSVFNFDLDFAFYQSVVATIIQEQLGKYDIRKLEQSRKLESFVAAVTAARERNSARSQAISNYLAGMFEAQMKPGYLPNQSNTGRDPDRTHDRPFGRGNYGENKGQTWYYMYRVTGNAHAMAYDPVNKVVYDINSWRDENGIQISVFDRLREYPLGDLSVAYEYHQDNKSEWRMLSEREAGQTWALAPFYLPDPTAATVWFQSHTGKSWGYAAGFNNCSIYAMDGLEAGGANIRHVNLNPAPSSVNSKPTIYWQFPAKP